MKIPPDYYESSEEEDGGVRKTVAACQCSGSGSCNFCKKMRGCTCEGAGTCRLCEMEERRDEEDDIEIIEESGPPPATSEEMSTTEYFLMTGRVRPPSQEVEEDDEDDIQVLEPQVPTTRGRGRGRARGRARGSRPVYVPLQRPLRPPMYHDSLTLAPRQGFVHNQIRPFRPVRPVRPPPTRGGERRVRSRGGQYNYRSPAPLSVRPQQRFLVARPVRPVRPPAGQYHQVRPARPAHRPVRGGRAESNLHTAYYETASQGARSVAAQYYDNITQHEVVDLSDDDDDEEEAALISRLPSGIRISKI